MNEHLQALGAFFLVLLASILSQRAEAAVALSPVVSGYSARSFSAASGSFTTSANAASYGATGVVNVGGKAVTVPATMRMASNAGQYVKNAMRLNPWGIAGTLAVAWLASEGLDWINNEWIKTQYLYESAPTGCPDYLSLDALLVCIKNRPGNAGYTWTLGTWPDGRVFRDGVHFSYYSRSGTPSTAPATPSDWDDLPDPLPAVATELPHAPYMPNGVPVDAPEYDFAPFQTPIGHPYTKPDGSTAQPMAKVSPNGDKVTVDTYEQPLTDTNGDPVPNPQPQDTPEPAPNHCEQNPNSIGCAQFGDIPAPDVLPETQIPASTTVVPIGGPGVCPASITTTKFGLTWSYQPICDFAQAAKPFILGFAWLGFAYIVAGTVRT